MSKAHFVKQRKSKYRCKIDKCGKHHHSLLHEPETPDKKHPQENKSQTLPVLVNSIIKVIVICKLNQLFYQTEVLKLKQTLYSIVDPTQP